MDGSPSLRLQLLSNETKRIRFIVVVDGKNDAAEEEEGEEKFEIVYSVALVSLSKERGS